MTSKKTSVYRPLLRPSRNKPSAPTCGCGTTDKSLHKGVTCEALKRKMADKAPGNAKRKCVKAPPPLRVRNHDDGSSASTSTQSPNDERDGRKQ